MARPDAGETASPIGIIAGGGALPAEVAASIVRRGGAVHILDINGAADAAVHAFPRTEVLWSKLGLATRTLKSAGVRDVLLLGTFARPDLRKARPDITFVRQLPAIISLLRAGGDDALLRSLVAILERQGFRVIGAVEAAPDLLATEGVLTAMAPGASDASDIVLGFRLIDALGLYDIGQAAVVREGRIVAIEAAEGTDRMLARVADAGGRGGVLVKRPKPSQDLRIDLPAIGPATVRNALAAGLSGLGVAAGRVLIAERQRLIEEADAAGLFVAGYAAQSEFADSLLTIIEPRQLGAIVPPQSSRGDIVNGVRIISVVCGFGGTSAAVLGAARVFAVGASDSAAAVIERANGIRARSGFQRVAVLAPGVAATEDLLNLADTGRYAGFVLVTRPGEAAQVEANVIAAADTRGQFVSSADMVAQGGDA